MGREGRWCARDDYNNPQHQCSKILTITSFGGEMIIVCRIQTPATIKGRARVVAAVEVAAKGRARAGAEAAGVVLPVAKGRAKVVVVAFGIGVLLVAKGRVAAAAAAAWLERTPSVQLLTTWSARLSLHLHLRRRSFATFIEWAKGKAEYYNNKLSALVAWQGEDTERGAPRRTREHVLLVTYPGIHQCQAKTTFRQPYKDGYRAMEQTAFSGRPSMIGMCLPWQISLFSLRVRKRSMTRLVIGKRAKPPTWLLCFVVPLSLIRTSVVG
jgi:hypothetical protein